MLTCYFILVLFPYDSHLLQAQVNIWPDSVALWGLGCGELQPEQDSSMAAAFSVRNKPLVSLT